jgi:D-glucuronyl C5-epimerase C-terminus
MAFIVSLSVLAIGVILLLLPSGPGFHRYKGEIRRSAVGYFAENAPTPSLVGGVAIIKNQSIIRGHSVFQPVSILEQGIACVQEYQRIKDQKFLHIAESELQLLNKTYPVNSQGERWISYVFPFALHQQQSLTINPPWHSGMAQGLAVELATSLFSMTGDKNYLISAQQYFAPLALVFKEKTLPQTQRFVSFVDPAGFLWFEEYAGDITPNRVINGHLYATLGIYDYWQATGSHQARDLFFGGVETIRHYFPEFRNPGGASWYSLGTKGVDKAASRKYHAIVTGQISYLGRLLGSHELQKDAQLLAGD